jgi:integrase
MGVSRMFPRGGVLWVKVQDSRQGIAPHNVSLGVPVDAKDGEGEAKRFALVKTLREGRYRPPAQSLAFPAFLAKYERHYVAAAGPERRASREASWLRDGAQLRHLLDWFAARGLKTLAVIQPKHCEQFRDARLAGDKALATVKHNQRVARAAWNWAIRQDLVSSNPWVGMRFPKETKQDPRNLSPLEIRQVFPLALSRNPDYHARMALALYAGLRMGECDRLLQSDLEWGQDGFIRLGPGKDGEPRTTLFPAELQAILTPWKKAHAPRSLVLGPTNHVVLQQFIARLSKRLTVPFSFHDLRKTFAGMLAARGVPTTRIRDYLGHSSVATTETHYVARCHEAVSTDSAALTFGLSAPGCPNSGTFSGPVAAKAASGAV